ALSFNTNGSERLRIDSSGRIGIGTSSPSAVLHLGGSSNQTIQIDGSSNTAYYGTNGDRGDLFVNYDPTSGTILNSARSTVGIQMDGADGGSNIGFRTTNANNVPSSERMRIDSDGKIGIGTSSVDGSNKLQIEETTANTGTGIKIESASWDSTLTLANGSHSWEILNDYSDNSSLAFYSSQGAAVRMLLDENGNVGIGCSSPASYNSKADDLVVLTSGDTGISIISGTSNEGAIAFGDGTSGGSPIMGRVRYDHSANSMDFRVNNDEAMRIDSSGNVGIGCSPKRQLHIHNPSAASSKLQITNSTTGSSSDGKGFQIGIGSDGTANIEQRENVDLVFHTNNTERMRLDASANLLVGKTATNSNAAGIELHANDVIKVTRSSGATGYFNRLTDDGSILEFAKDGSLVGSIGSNAAGGDPVLDLTATKIMRMVVDGSTEAMRISSNGNTGIGVVPEAWHSAFNGVLQVGTYGVMAGTAGSAQFGSNFYYDGAYRRINTNYASRTYQQDGAHVFETAASGSAGSTITWSEAMRLDASGNVGIGTSSVSAKLHLGGTAPLDSIIRQDATVSGTNWEIGEREAGKWQIFEDDTDSVVATFMSSGNVGIGTNSPTQKLQVSGGSFLQQQSGATNNTAPTAVTVSNLTTGAHAAGLGASLLFTHVNSGGGYNGPKISSVSNADPFTANLVFYSHNYSHSEAMRLDASGNLLVGTTTAVGLGNGSSNEGISISSTQCQLIVATSD
ncbi:MAG: hypothetical protein GY918_08055, partial [Gammaproteobacteria bacterium]|nr:hypothetical protein [Gammaproteobacteria bacterium]